MFVDQGELSENIFTIITSINIFRKEMRTKKNKGCNFKIASET